MRATLPTFATLASPSPALHRRRRRPAALGRSWAALLCAGMLALCSSAAAQGPPDLNLLVIDWASGAFASPVMCEIDGEVVRGIRRLTLVPHQDVDRRVVAVLQFVDMEIDEASRCFDTLGHTMPNLVGKLYLRVPGRSRPDTARLDFKRALERERGFTFEVLRGALKVTEASKPPSEPTVVDFRGGEVRITMIAPASDADRQLAPFRSARKALLQLKSRGEVSLDLPIFEAPR